jgi:hypothetical protein
MSSGILYLYCSSLFVWDELSYWRIKNQYYIFPLADLSSRVMSNALGFLLASHNILFLSGLHMEANTSRNYHDINTNNTDIFYIFLPSHSFNYITFKSRINIQITSQLLDEGHGL